MSHPSFSSAERTVWLGPLRCDDISREALVNELVTTVGAEPVLFFNINAHSMNLALKEPNVADAFNASDITFCDGFGILVLDRIFGRGTLRHRTTMPDLLGDPGGVYDELHRAGGRVFLLGDEEQNVAAYAARVEAEHPGFVAGWHSGFFPHEGPEEAAIVERINALDVDLLLVGMGMPRQEFWILRNRPRLRVKRMMSVGATFAWDVSERRRGPRWATDRGLEWFFRLLYEPRRVWRRYLVGLPEVTWRLMRYRGAEKNPAEF